MKKSTFVAMVGAGVVTGVATYAIVESGVVEKTEDFVVGNSKKAISKVKGLFKKKAAVEEPEVEEELVEVDAE